MKKIVIINLAILFHMSCLAQHGSVSEIIDEINNTLKEYNLCSENVHRYNLKYEDTAETSSVKFDVRHGNMVFLIDDYCVTPTDEFKSGVHVVSAPISSIKVYKPYNGNRAITISASGPIEVWHDGTKTLTKEYRLYGVPAGDSRFFSLFDELMEQKHLLNTYHGGTTIASEQLRSAYFNVVNTLNEYRFASEDVNDSPYAKTESITLKIQAGLFVFGFKDDFGSFSNPNYGNRNGTKIIKVPIFNAYWGDRYDYTLRITCPDGVEMTYKGKKELLRQYSIHGEDLTLNKLRKELIMLQCIAITEGFNGTLEITPHVKNSTPKTNTARKRSGGSSSQRQRKRVPAGN